ncbi:MAG TPA: Fe-S-containing protein [Blastocatellia bacterium]|nr:Fe-S-containing protein [Blastocatellia bacterium]
MFESAVVTLREGVEAALIVAIVLGYLRKINRSDLAKSAYIGLVAAAGFAVAAAILFRRFEMNEDLWLEGWGMLIASAFVATMVIWMWRTASRMKGDIENRIGQAASSASGNFSFGIFIFVFLMVAREGIETVLFLAAVRFNTTKMMNFVGGLIGLGLAIVFGFLFVKGSIRINLRKFFSITSVILLVVAIQLLISGLHGLSEAQVLPASEREMAIIGPIVQNNAFFYIIILALTGLMLIWQRQRPQALPVDANPAERRKALHLARRERMWTRSLGALALLSITMITAQFVYSAAPTTTTEQVFKGGGPVNIQVSRVDDGKLHHFEYTTADGGTVRFILIKLDSGKIGVALDACQICGDKGYYQQGQEIICRNCTAAINPASIGQSGGCNPIELNAKQDGQDITIQPADLDASARFFGTPAR